MKKILLFFMFLFLILPSQVNATQFNGYTNNTSMNSTDELILWDTPNGAVRNITFANFGVSLESPLELIIDLQDLQGSVTDSQVPNTITVDLSTTATTANNLAADGVNALTEIDQSIKTAANDTSKLVVGTAGATDECAKWDANGNLVTAGAACGSGGGGGGLNNVVEDTTPQLGGDLDMNGKGIDFPTTANITDVLDEDSMTSNSPTALATQQSIKAYVDNSVAAAGGGDITSVGNCTTSACFGGASGNTLTSTTSEIIDMSTASTFIYQRDDAGSVTFMGKDNSTPADTIYDTFGAGSVTVGSGDVTAVTITTDGTGTGELVVPNDSITLGTETVGNYAAGDSEAGAATTGDTATAFFSIGQIERARGGTGTDTSAYGVGLIGSDVSNNTVDVDTEAELETALAGADVVVVATDDITSANLATIVSNETGSGLVVFGTSPTIATPILTGKIDRNNVAVDDDDCTGEQGNAWYDTTDFAFEFCNSNSGTPSVLGGGASSPGGADTYVQYNDGGVLGGDAGMVYNETTNALTVDGTGTFDGLVVNGAGTDSLLSTNGIFDLGGTTQERLRLTFTGSDIVTATSTTGVTTFNFSSIALQESGVGVLNADEIDASSELLAIMDDETGTGALVFGTSPSFTTPSLGAATSTTLTASGKITGNASLDVKNGATTSGVLAIYEDSDAGTNFASFQVPSLAANTVYTLPEDDGDAGEQLQTDGSGGLTWEAAGSGGSGDSISVNSSAATDANFTDGDIVWTLNTGATPDGVSASIASGAVLPGMIDKTSTLSSFAEGANATAFATTGIIFEGATNDTIEGLLTAADVASSDKTWTLPNETGTICTTGSVCSGYQASVTAGRSLTATGATVDADAELYTDSKTLYFENPTASDDFKTIAVANTGWTITSISCESDQTVNFDLQVDDGSPTGVNGSDIACTTFATDSSLAGDTTMASGDRLDLAITSVSGTPTWVSITFGYTKDE